MSFKHGQMFSFVGPSETWTVCQRHAFPLKLFKKAVKHQVARQYSRHRGLEESRIAKHACSLKASTANMDWSSYKNPDERLPKKVIYGRWLEETLQRHPKSLSEGFRNTNGVLGTDCTGAIKVARSHQRRSSFV